jgi:hypothetical protein
MCLEGLLGRYGVLESAAGTDVAEIESHTAEIHGKPASARTAPQTDARVPHRSRLPPRARGNCPFPAARRVSARPRGQAGSFLNATKVSHYITFVNGRMSA